MKHLLQIAAATLFLCLMLPVAAKADYEFCNRTSYVLDAAIGFEAESGWMSRGWVRILPGDCAPMLQGPVDERDYYVFARSMDAHDGSIKYFSGNTGFCVVENAFEIEGREQCAIRGFDSADFQRVRTSAGKGWTTSFAEASDYTPEQARIAGTQRLLHDLGFALRQVDGIAARNTLRAVQAFQRSEDLPATGRIDTELLEQLVERAIANHASVGLDLCNRTDDLVWASIGYQNGDDKISSGWIRIEAGSCRKAIKGKLLQDAYYVYAEAIDHSGSPVRRDGADLVWGGNDSFCTKATRFEIRGRENCAARGFDERGFLRVETGDELYRSVSFE